MIQHIHAFLLYENSYHLFLHLCYIFVKQQCCLYLIYNASSLTYFANYHCVKSVRIRSYSGSHFSRIFLHSDLIQRDTPPYLSVFSPNAGKNSNQNKSEYAHFLRSLYYSDTMISK